MKTYFAALINKPTASENSKLSKKLLNDLKKSLRIPNSNLHFKEHNTFIFWAAETPLKKNLNQKDTGKIEAKTALHLKQYYLNYKDNLQKYLKTKQELKETAQIVKDFLKEIDPKLPEEFNSRLGAAISELPEQHCELQSQSIVALWDLNDEKKARFLLSGWTPPIFEISEPKEPLNLEAVVDKVALFNFSWIFLQPTVLRLREMKRVLESLHVGLEGTHYKSDNPKVQAKLEIFFRILSAKLSALQNVDKTISAILGLFNEPRLLSSQSELMTTSEKLKTSLRQMVWKINEGKGLLLEVQDKLDECQNKLQEYLDETKNGVKTAKSMDEFKLALRPIAELSSDLFVEAELLKMWMDFFGTDLPYFTYQTKLFTDQASQNTETSKENIIEVRGLTKNYNLGRTTAYALRGVDLDIKEGEFVAIIGNSGAGKTTLLNCMAGLDEPDYGIVLFKGKNLHKMDDEQKSKARLLDMGFIFQSYALLPHYNTRENVTLPANLAGLSQGLKARIEGLLEGVGISKQAKQYPAQLSGGQMQRVAIARALTNRPKVLFADEPTGDLDSETGKQVMELIERFHEETKTTIIVISHEQSIADYAERQVMMKDGIIISPHSTKVSRRREEAIPKVPYEERANKKQTQYPKLLFAAFAVQIVLTVLILAVLLQIDQIVHGTLYSYGLQFSNTWALPYWAFHKFAVGLTCLIFGLSAFLIVYVKRINHREAIE
jgi:putative ABC transport system ATP-binding protein